MGFAWRGVEMKMRMEVTQEISCSSCKPIGRWKNREIFYCIKYGCMVLLGTYDDAKTLFHTDDEDELDAAKIPKKLFAALALVKMQTK